MDFRLQKVNTLLQEEVAKIILKEVDFENCIVTVTKAETVSNFSRSDIFITVMPDEKEKEALKSIKDSIYEIQNIINKRLRMKYVPKLFFKIDKGAKNLYKIDKFCKKNKKNEE